MPVSRKEERTQRLACKAMNAFAGELRITAAEAVSGPSEAGKSGLENKAGTTVYAANAGVPFSARAQYGMIKEWFAGREKKRQEAVRQADERLTNAFRFLSRVYGEGQEMVLFLTELSAGYYSLRFLNEHGNESYFRFNRLLLLRDNKDLLRNEVLSLME